MELEKKAAIYAAMLILAVLAVPAAILGLVIVFFYHFANGGYWTPIFRKFGMYQEPGMPEIPERERELKAKEDAIREKENIIKENDEEIARLRALLEEK